MSSSDHKDDILDEEPPTTIDPYKVLSLSRDATEAQVKTAYRKAALKHHPDKVPESERIAAHTKFQEIALAYAILSDSTRRNIYDTTGSTSESILTSDDFNWCDFYRAQFTNLISAETIARFKASYKNSDEEKYDLLAAYEEAKGDMDCVYESVMLSDVHEDDERFREIIDEAIKKGDVKAFPVYIKDTKAERNARKKTASAEAKEAEEYAKELGIHDKLFGVTVESDSDPAPKGKSTSKSTKDSTKKASAKYKKKKESSEDALAALICIRQQERSGFLNALEARYMAKESKGGKRKREKEKIPTEEEFERIQMKIKKPKVGGKGHKAQTRR